MLVGEVCCRISINRSNPRGRPRVSFAEEARAVKRLVVKAVAFSHTIFDQSHIDKIRSMGALVWSLINALKYMKRGSDGGQET